MKWKLLLAGVIAVALLTPFLIRQFNEARWRTVTVSIFSSSPERSVPMRLLAKNEPKPLADVAEFKGYGSYRIDRKIPLSNLQIQINALDGWQSCRFESDNRDGKLTLRPRCGFLHLWIDNLHGKAAKLKCGEHEIEIQPNSKSDHGLPAPLKDAVKVYLDEREIGVIPPIKGDDSLLLDDGYFVDCSGKNRYRWSNISFVSKDKSPLPDPLNLGTLTRTLDPGYFHKLGSSEVDYFLTPAPQIIDVKTYGPQFFGTRTTRNELVRQ